ncbi:MAG TPA: type II secretion system protein [Roseiarcus sp.]|nr:type II secretion system protein [Roseiarcus sp.]
MRFASIGIPAGYQSKRRKRNERRSGFTLLEALVALSLLLIFSAALGPTLFHARRILARGDGQIRAELLLRSLLTSPFDPADPSVSTGESAGFRWSVAVEPFAEAASFEPQSARSDKAPPYNWSLYKVTALVVWGGDRSLTAETLRLGKAE